MATHDYVIDNQSAPSFRSDLNNALQAIVTQNSNATAPTTTYANMVWYDTAANQLKKRNEANSAWIVLGTIDEALSTFTPSGERALASQAQAEAGTDNTTVMTPLRSAQALSARIGSATAGLAIGSVGSVAFLARGVQAAITAGTTYAGSDLRYAALYSGSFGGTTGAVQMSSAGSYVTGTWMALGSNGATNYPIAVFLRVA